MTRMAISLTLALFCLLALSACKPAPVNPYPGAENYGAQLLDRLRGQCEDKDGTFSRGGKSGALVCHTTPTDAGKSCAKHSDCSTQCLARSRTCAPIAPLFGCNEVLTDEGAPVTLCID